MHDDINGQRQTVLSNRVPSPAKKCRSIWLIVSGPGCPFCRLVYSGSCSSQFTATVHGPIWQVFRGHVLKNSVFSLLVMSSNSSIAV